MSSAKKRILEDFMGNNAPSVPMKKKRHEEDRRSSNNGRSMTPRSTSGYHQVQTPETTSQKPQYVDGSICKIELSNFMTHEKFEWEPCARVNLITGVNGSGKSTILQAIVIGLGKYLKN